MTIRSEARIVSFDADAALAAAEETVEGVLYTFVEYDLEEFDPLYVDDATMTFYDDEEAMRRHFARIHDHVHMDFAEHDLFTESLFPASAGVEYAVTGMDYMTFVRVYGDREGVFFAVEPAESVTPLVEAVRDAM